MKIVIYSLRDRLGTAETTGDADGGHGGPSIVPVANGQLVLLEQAKQALAEVKTVPEAKKIRDQAEAIRNYLRVQGASFEAQQDAAEIKVRAERRIGELLGPAGPQGKHVDHSNHLNDDINPEWKRRWRAQALLPEDEFEEHLTECREEEKEITSRAVFQMGNRIARQNRQREENLADEEDEEDQEEYDAEGDSEEETR